LRFNSFSSPVEVRANAPNTFGQLIYSGAGTGSVTVNIASPTTYYLVRLNGSIRVTLGSVAVGVTTNCASAISAPDTGGR
jgi:hypothetical protein